jgi:ankyrin repeat protein
MELCYPLHVAVETDNVELAAVLLDAGVDINARRRSGATAIVGCSSGVHCAH